MAPSSVLRPLISVLRLPSRRPGGYGEGLNTRSHPELGREIPQRQWYCVLRRGRVGRRQVFKTEPKSNPHKTHSSSQRTESGKQRTEVTNPHRRPLVCPPFSVLCPPTSAGWSSPVARQAHNLKVVGSNPTPATTDSERLGPNEPGRPCLRASASSSRAPSSPYSATSTLASVGVTGLTDFLYRVK